MDAGTGDDKLYESNSGTPGSYDWSHDTMIGGVGTDTFYYDPNWLFGDTTDGDPMVDILIPL